MYALKDAICTEAGYPYAAKAGHCAVASCNKALPPGVIPKGDVFGISDVKRRDPNALMAAVAGQPVAVAIEADQRVFQFYKSGVSVMGLGVSLCTRHNSPLWENCAGPTLDMPESATVGNRTGLA